MTSPTAPGALDGDGIRHPGLKGIGGHAYVDLGPPLAAQGVSLDLSLIHEEICLALASLPVDYTGGSHRSMGIMPPARAAEALVDYGEVIASLSDSDFQVFRSLADDPKAIDPERRAELTYGEERDVPLSRRQMLWLKTRFGVYFPWKGYVELIPNRRWGDKSSSRGKTFTRTAQSFFPRTIAFVKSLPFVEVGRCNIMGLEANDHGTVHRDGDPAEQEAVDQFITLVPARNKRLFLYDAEENCEIDVKADIYWFNDFDYHGVRADPFFRYSVRIDGVFTDSFMRDLSASIDERKRAKAMVPSEELSLKGPTS